MVGQIIIKGCRPCRDPGQLVFRSKRAMENTFRPRVKRFFCRLFHTEHSPGAMASALGRARLSRNGTRINMHSHLRLKLVWGCLHWQSGQIEPLVHMWNAASKPTVKVSPRRARASCHCLTSLSASSKTSVVEPCRRPPKAGFATLKQHGSEGFTARGKGQLSLPNVAFCQQ